LDIEGEVPEELNPPYISQEIEKTLGFIFKNLTQLRVISGMDSSVLGLDYTAMLALAKIYDFEIDARRMDLIRVAEQKIIQAYNRR